MSTTVGFILGLVGNLAFGLKSLPQVIKCIRKKSASGLSMTMLIFDFIGNIACSTYIYTFVGFDVWFQFVNYGLATILLLVLFFLKHAYRGKDEN